MLKLAESWLGLFFFLIYQDITSFIKFYLFYQVKIYYKCFLVLQKALNPSYSQSNVLLYLAPAFVVGSYSGQSENVRVLEPPAAAASCSCFPVVCPFRGCCNLHRACRDTHNCLDGNYCAPSTALLMNILVVAQKAASWCLCRGEGLGQTFSSVRAKEGF